MIPDQLHGLTVTVYDEIPLESFADRIPQMWLPITVLRPLMGRRQFRRFRAKVRAGQPVSFA